MSERASNPGVELGGPTPSPLDRGPLGLRRRILIADDDPDTRSFYGWGLRAAGWFVTEASDGFEAVGLAAALRPHAIVMDLCMPGLGGVDAVVCLKHDIRTRTIPVVALSGLDHIRAEASALEAGCDAFVAKPCSPDRLSAVLEELTRRRAIDAPPSSGLSLVDGASDSLPGCGTDLLVVDDADDR